MIRETRRELKKRDRKETINTHEWRYGKETQGAWVPTLRARLPPDGTSQSCTIPYVDRVTTSI